MTSGEPALRHLQQVNPPFVCAHACIEWSGVLATCVQHTGCRTVLVGRTATYEFGGKLPVKHAFEDHPHL